MDQASDQTNTIDNRRGEFQLDVTEAPPTPDQMRNILDYLAAKGVKPSAVVPGARNAEDAIKRVKESDANGIVRPIVSVSPKVVLMFLFNHFEAIFGDDYADDVACR